MKTKITLFLILSVFVLSACKTSRSVESAPKTPAVKSDVPTIKNVTAKLDVSVKTKSDDISVDGKLYMRYDEIIRITIVPYGIMEAARLEFTPNEVILIDRINKQYVKASYAELPFMSEKNITFKVLQQRFWSDYTKQHLTLDAGGAFLDIRLSKINNDATWDASPTDVGNRYKSVSAADIMKQFNKF